MQWVKLGQIILGSKKWYLGFFLSLIFALFVSYFFVNTLVTYKWDEDINGYIISPGTVCKFHSEGNGRTFIGKYGVNGVADITKIPLQKIAVWGDSYVEAFNVDDKNKLNHLFNELCISEGMSDIYAFARGRSGDSIADYFFNIPKYENIIPSIIAHVIIIADITDLYPDQEGTHCEFRSHPTLSLVEKKVDIPFQNVKRVFQKYNADFLWNILKAALFENDLRFTLGIINLNKKTETHEVKTASLLAISWDYLLKRFKEQTNLPIIFVYCPHVPRIDNGGIIYDDSQSDIINDFNALCNKYGYGFINMKDDFCSYYRESKKFPRGFHNSRIAAGHFNENGHLLVAKRIFQYMKENKRAM